MKKEIFVCIITGIIIGILLGLIFAAKNLRIEVENIKKEIIYLNNVSYTQQQKVSDIQYQKDQLERYTHEYASGKITKEELASRVEDIQPRSPLLKIKRHKVR